MHCMQAHGKISLVAKWRSTVGNEYWHRMETKWSKWLQAKGQTSEILNYGGDCRAQGRINVVVTGLSWTRFFKWRKMLGCPEEEGGMSTAARRHCPEFQGPQGNRRGCWYRQSETQVTTKSVKGDDGLSSFPLLLREKQLYVKHQLTS